MDIFTFMVEQGDEEALERITQLSETFAEECELYRILKFNREKFKQYARKFTIAGSGAVIIGASVYGEIVGYTAVVADDMCTDKPRLEMATFYVHPEFRNSGVGAALADKFCELIAINGIEYAQVSICAHFEKDRELIQRATELLFRRRGFKQIGVIMGKTEDKNA